MKAGNIVYQCLSWVSQLLLACCTILLGRWEGAGWLRNRHITHQLQGKMRKTLSIIIACSKRNSSLSIAKEKELEEIWSSFYQSSFISKFHTVLTEVEIVNWYSEVNFYLECSLSFCIPLHSKASYVKGSYSKQFTAVHQLTT